MCEAINIQIESLLKQQQYIYSKLWRKNNHLASIAGDVITTYFNDYCSAARVRQRQMLNFPGFIPDFRFQEQNSRVFQPAASKAELN